MSQIIPMSLVDGTWRHAEESENDLIWELEQLSGVDLTAYDILLNDSRQWEGHENNRQYLAGLRHELRHTFGRHFENTDRLELQVENYRRAFDMVRMQITGVALETKDLTRKAQSKTAAQQPRPSAQCPFKKAIQAAMKNHRLEGLTFKEFMQSWRQNPIHGLSITPENHGEKYIVFDENGDLGDKEYAWGTLQSMYSEKKKK